MKVLKTICADEGMILTNGKVYGRVILLAEGMNEADFYEITEEEYEKIMEEKEQDDGGYI